MAIDKNILSVDSDNDDMSYLAFSEYLEEDTKRKKNFAAAEIDMIAENLLKEIEIKNKNKAIKSNKLIQYIIKHCDNKYTVIELKSYDFKDIQDIYNEIKKQKQSKLIKFFHFIFNIQSEVK